MCYINPLTQTSDGRAKLVEKLASKVHTEGSTATRGERDGEPS